MQRKQPVSQAALEAFPETLKITGAAVVKVKQLLASEDQGGKNLHLRVFITGGGCSGFQYGFTFDEKIAEDDTRFEVAGISVLIDATSLQYMQGAEIDYAENLMGSRFVVNNPQARTTCSCGSSFSI